MIGFWDLMKKLADHRSVKLPFVVYREPKKTKVKAIFQKDAALHKLKDFTESGFLMAPFNWENPMFLLHGDEQYSAFIPPMEPKPFKEVEDFIPDSSQKKFYMELVKKGITFIEEGMLRKVVLSRRIETDLRAMPLEIFQRLLPQYPNAFCYLWSHPKVGTWLGATPEVLLKSDGQSFATISLAGTQGLKKDGQPIWGPKEKEEQEMVTNYMMAALSEKSTQLKRFPIETIQAGNLLHLRTKISGVFGKGSLESVIKTLHPTPAVCGLPTSKAKKFILENENYERGFYTGYLGEINMKESTRLYVNLRCAQIKDQKVMVYVGGGITRDSNPLSEWEETIAKSMTVLNLL